ncbi:hypothetical protein ACFYXS_20215 [Streptomyces sp. NPDC002574]
MRTPHAEKTDTNQHNHRTALLYEGDVTATTRPSHNDPGPGH